MSIDDTVVRTLRLTAHGLNARGLSSPIDAVGRLLAVQAQNPSDAAWSIGLRVPGATSTSVADEVARGSILRTWTMRGTLHFVLPEDARWMLSLLAPRAYGARAKLWRDAELSEKVFESAREIAVRALSGNLALSRAALLQAFEECGIRTAFNRGSHIIRYLAETQTLVPGPPAGKTQTFVLFDEWIPKSKDLSREESLGLLALRYIRGHGPATARDLAWWSGLTLRDAQYALQLSNKRLETIDTANETLFVAPEALQPPQTASARPNPAAHLLPGFDEYHIGYADRRLILNDAYKAAVGPAKNGLFRSPLLYDGVIRGTWSKTTYAKELAVELTHFEPRDALPIHLTDAACHRYAMFLSSQ